MKLKQCTKCKDCVSCVDLYNDGNYYCHIKIIDPKYSSMDISTCLIDPENKPEDCPWDETSKVINSLNREDQIAIKCMTKMFGGSGVKDWFEDDMTNKEWLASLPADQFYDEFKKIEHQMTFDLNTRMAMIEWLDKIHAAEDQNGNAI